MDPIYSSFHHDILRYFANMALPIDMTWAEHIAFLRLLYNTPPEKPSKNNPGNLPIRHDEYVLPFDRERQFVGACAFLSNIKTRIESIPAVCVRENHETNSLELLVAVNKRTADDGREYLRDMKSGFQGVFNALRRANIGELSHPLTDVGCQYTKPLG